MQEPDYSKKQREPGEEVYSDYDSEFEFWAVFGLNSGFCYRQFYNETEADEYANTMNKNRQPTEA